LVDTIMSQSRSVHAVRRLLAVAGLMIAGTRAPAAESTAVDPGTASLDPAPDGRPQPVVMVAKRGDTHLGLLRQYLESRGVPGPEITRLALQVTLRPLAPGQRVWAYYHDGVLGTWITNGPPPTSAPPPSEPPAASTRAAVVQRDAARAEVRSLQRELTQADKDIELLKKDRAALRAEIGTWAHEADAARAEARAAVDAAHYMAGARWDLLDRGILSGGLFKGTRVRQLIGLDALDLTQTNEIVLRAVDHGMLHIEKVKLLPDGYEYGQDYVVELLRGGTVARVALLDVAKFKRSTFVVVLE
jgi:hypothetical protein